LEHVACNLCGSSRLTPVYEIPDRFFFPQEFFTVVECDLCGLGFVNPRPSREEIQRHYPPEYFVQPDTQSHRRCLSRRFSEQAKYLREMERPGCKPRLLDVGCANGDFPRFMAARGWSVEGVEVADSSQPIQDFKVYRQQFMDIPVSQATYDAVTAWAVLEHVHDPMAYFRKAGGILKRGGLFVFLVPNFKSPASRCLFCEDVPRHLYFFTRKTVRQYLDAAGLALEMEDNNRNVYKVAPYNWLAFQFKTRLRKQKFTFQDVKLNYREYLQLHHLPRGFASTLGHAVYAPTAVIDRILWPVIESVQILRKTYGNSTFVARKP
jgi:2-polyprenyl-3-methyl-5-hydroxy-6-metoxy-1,4-benzoquinol methylase